MKTIQLRGKGVGHEDRNLECQDRLSVTRNKNSTVFAVSDGCSSSEFGGESAQCNIDIINKIFSSCTIDSFTPEALKKLYPYLENADNADVLSCLSIIFKYELAKNGKKLKEDVAPGDLCATLLFVVREEEKTAIGHIGDGNIIMYDSNGKEVFRSEEKNGASSSETFFTIGGYFEESFRFDVIQTESYDSLILFSDGPQTMFKLENNYDISAGAYDLVVEPCVNGRIKTGEELKLELQKTIAHAMHYVFDDWSIITAFDFGNPDEEIQENTSEPISLKQLFMEEYNRQKSAPEEVPEKEQPSSKDADNDSFSSPFVSDAKPIDRQPRSDSPSPNVKQKKQRYPGPPEMRQLTQAEIYRLKRIISGQTRKPQKTKKPTTFDEWLDEIFGVFFV